MFSMSGRRMYEMSAARVALLVCGSMSLWRVTLSSHAGFSFGIPPQKCSRFRNLLAFRPHVCIRNRVISALLNDKERLL